MGDAMNGLWAGAGEGLAGVLRGLGGGLGERVVLVGAGAGGEERELAEDGEFVLCWLHHAVRGHENPVLDVAVSVGNAAGKPVLVYQGLGGRHRFNSDRHHVFIMEGARDLARELESRGGGRGIGYVFRLPRDPEERGVLRGLAARSCCVVAEDYPAPPMPAWTERLAASVEVPVLAVDGACLMPVRSLGKRHNRAFKFRKSAEKYWDGVIGQPWRDVEPEVERVDVGALDLGFEPVHLEGADLTELAAGCEIDHAVPPVGRVEGGSQAGYARWEAFKEKGLRRYADRRNDAADMDAVSCLSPWLHHGHVSPFRVAREAAEFGGKGADKFLDELLTWRELAFNFCAHTDSEKLESLRAIPEWAVETLREHERDERPLIASWETLSRAKTGDELWDLMQRSLLVNGELHNNVRMTWGKALLKWTRNADEALRLLIDLNHRYALDGNDPNSYGGLLWCLGQFDRAFEPGEKILGTVRGRDTEVHAQRLRPAEYAAAIEARRGYAGLKVAVVGGGITGLACARVLVDQGCEAVVFDKGRAPGGRVSTRTAEVGDRKVTFDHGAPGFRVSDARFGRYVRSWIQDGVCARWEREGSEGGPWIVGMPTMAAVAGHLAGGLEVRSSTGVTGIERRGDEWAVSFEGQGDGEVGTEAFDAVVLAMAPEQAGRLVPGGMTGVAEAVGGVRSEAQWVLMVALSDRLEGVAPAGTVVVEDGEDGPIEAWYRDDSKPGRVVPDGVSTVVLHAGSGWSSERYDVPREEVLEELLSEALKVLGERAGRELSREAVVFARAHRWGLARPTGATGSVVEDTEARLVVAGDGFGGRDVEGAFLNGHAAAGRVLSWRPRREERDVAGTLFSDADSGTGE